MHIKALIITLILVLFLATGCDQQQTTEEDKVADAPENNEEEQEEETMENGMPRTGLNESDVQNNIKEALARHFTATDAEIKRARPFDPNLFIERTGVELEGNHITFTFQITQKEAYPADLEIHYRQAYLDIDQELSIELLDGQQEEIGRAHV